jgi:Type II secretory pathway, component PulF
VRGYNTVRFASTLGILTAAGVPILRALQAAAETLSNNAMRENIDDAIVRVREGTSCRARSAIRRRFRRCWFT